MKRIKKNLSRWFRVLASGNKNEGCGLKKR